MPAWTGLKISSLFGGPGLISNIICLLPPFFGPVQPVGKLISLLPVGPDPLEKKSPVICRPSPARAKNHLLFARARADLYAHILDTLLCTSHVYYTLQFGA